MAAGMVIAILFHVLISASYANIKNRKRLVLAICLATLLHTARNIPIGHTFWHASQIYTWAVEPMIWNALLAVWIYLSVIRDKSKTLFGQTRYTTVRKLKIGKVERTLFILDWLENPSLRRRCQAGVVLPLNWRFLPRSKVTAFDCGKIPQSFINFTTFANFPI